MKQTDELLTANDVAQLFKISADTVYSWRYRGKIPYVKINGAVRFRPSDIDQMIEDGRRQGRNEERLRG
jgi:excisionase family DNA binding protein